MKEHPILFSSEMVRAILDGRKTQTRRVIKPQLLGDVISAERWVDGFWRIEHEPAPAPIGEYVGLRLRCPYGVPGDRLWVREGWAVSKRLDNLPPRKLEFLTANRDFPQSTIYYRADSYNGVNPLRGRWRPSIFMPRWACRIMLEVMGVRVERVQDINNDDILAEGIVLKARADGLEGWSNGIDNLLHIRPRNAFWPLWDSINAKRGYSWAANPWVWVIEFSVVK